MPIRAHHVPAYFEDLRIFWISIAMTIMAGLTFGTVLTMILVPVFYATLHKIKSPEKAEQ